MREPQHMGRVSFDPSARHEVRIDDVALVQRGETTLLASRRRWTTRSGCEATMVRASVPRILRAGAFTQLPPLWIAHAEHDRNVTLAMSEELVAACRDAGGAAELEVFVGVGHAFANHPGEAAERCVERMRSVVACRLAASRTTRRAP